MPLWLDSLHLISQLWWKSRNLAHTQDFGMKTIDIQSREHLNGSIFPRQAKLIGMTTHIDIPKKVRSSHIVGRKHILSGTLFSRKRLMITRLYCDHQLRVMGQDTIRRD